MTDEKSSPLPAAPPTTLMRHYLRYLSANVLGIFAGFISLPVMTRLLSNHDYGIFGYFELVILIYTAVLKLGTQHSIQRFYAAYCLGEDRERREQFYASLVLAPALISLVVCFVSILGLALVCLIHPLAEVRYVYVVLILGQMAVLHSLFDNVIRAREHSALSSRLGLVGTYGRVFLVIFVITYLWRTAMGVYVAQMVCGLAILAFYLVWAWRHCEFKLRAFSPALFRTSLAYSLPLVLSENAFILLAFADRFLIKYLMKGNFEALGIYTIGYSTAMYIGQFITNSLIPAFQPVCNRIYESQGREAALALQRQVLRVLYYVAAAISVGIVFVGRDLFILCTGPTKVASAQVFQWVGVNYVLLSIFTVLAYGLNLTRRTKVISLVAFFAAALNIGLNLVMIPRWGIMGAVYATLICYGLMGVGQLVFLPTGYLPTPRWGEILRPLGLGALMGGVAWAAGLMGTTGLVGNPGHLARLSIMAGLFLLTFVLPMLALDRDLRQQVRQKFFGAAVPVAGEVG